MPSSPNKMSRILSRRWDKLKMVMALRRKDLLKGSFKQSSCLSLLEKTLHYQSSVKNMGSKSIHFARYPFVVCRFVCPLFGQGFSCLPFENKSCRFDVLVWRSSPSHSNSAFNKSMTRATENLYRNSSQVHPPNSSCTPTFFPIQEPPERLHRFEEAIKPPYRLCSNIRWIFPIEDPLTAD